MQFILKKEALSVYFWSTLYLFVGAITIGYTLATIQYQFF